MTLFLTLPLFCPATAQLLPPEDHLPPGGLKVELDNKGQIIRFGMSPVLCFSKGQGRFWKKEVLHLKLSSYL